MSKWRDMLLERIPSNSIIRSAEGLNGLLAVTSDIVYMVRGAALERKAIKSYALKSVTSIELKKPGLMFNGHFQVITSGNGDRTRRNSSAFDYARDENTIMLRSHHYEEFVSIEQVIYAQRDAISSVPAPVAAAVESDVFEKIAKLAKLKEQRLISEAEYEEKRAKLLSEI